MFGIKRLQQFFVCDKIITRSLRNRRFDTRQGPNPGMNKRIQAFREEGVELDEDTEEFIESSVSDFSNIGVQYQKHIHESVATKHDLRHQIVKEKYFTEHMPNLLTWSEKEQIRHLANTAPDQWTPERIAESFPVTAQIAKKLLKYQWKPATLQRITRHDASAVRNWKELKEGSLNIPNNLREHFLKFSERSIPPLNKTSIKIDLSQENKMGEFAQIVRRCASSESQSSADERQTHSNMNNDPTKATNKETSLTSDNMPLQSKNKRVTLSELTKNIQQSVDRGNLVNIKDEIIIKNVHSKDSEMEAIRDIEDIDLTLREESTHTGDLVKHNNETSEKNSVMDYPERIRIPKKLYKRGATYKVNDCYYDHHGIFLYRVLGMGV